jgi:hypothetical protein
MISLLYFLLRAPLCKGLRLFRGFMESTLVHKDMLVCYKASVTSLDQSTDGQCQQKGGKSVTNSKSTNLRRPHQKQEGIINGEMWMTSNVVPSANNVDRYFDLK